MKESEMKNKWCGLCGYNCRGRECMFCVEITLFDEPDFKCKFMMER
jgi:hypothetical protein